LPQLYKSYEQTLRSSDSLDFDDLLVFGLKLFRASPGILKNCKHILVDEFQVRSSQDKDMIASFIDLLWVLPQDTNTTQYLLMKQFAKAHGGVTIVGDPDQSIYGWRAAGKPSTGRSRKAAADVYKPAQRSRI
jgi:DNA helicase-2/ATP-dependent DNA helicase PcrA